jgi:hypothetical protein
MRERIPAWLPDSQVERLEFKTDLELRLAIPLLSPAQATADLWDTGAWQRSLNHKPGNSISLMSFL